MHKHIPPNVKEASTDAFWNTGRQIRVACYLIIIILYLLLPYLVKEISWF